MDSVTTRRCSVYPALNLFIHGITPPLIAAPTITAAHPPSEGHWVAVRILVVLVCLPSHIRRKCWNFVPLMERWEDHCVDYNLKLKVCRRLILEVWVCLRSLNPQESKKCQDRHPMDCNTKVQFQTFRILVVMVYQPTPSSHKSQNYVPRMERLVRHCMNCNRTIHFQMLLILVVVACLQSPIYQGSPGVLPRLEQ